MTDAFEIKEKILGFLRGKKMTENSLFVGEKTTFQDGIFWGVAKIAQALQHNDFSRFFVNLPFSSYILFYFFCVSTPNDCSRSLFLPTKDSRRCGTLLLSAPRLFSQSD